MQSREFRGSILRAIDLASESLAMEAEARLERGRDLAGADARRLADLARRLADDVLTWSREIAGLEVSLAAPMTPCRAGQLLAESLFDEVMTPMASHLLTLWLDLHLGES
jgi:hypothetical protein